MCENKGIENSYTQLLINLTSELIIYVCVKHVLLRVCGNVLLRYLPTQSNRQCANLETKINHQLHEIVESRRKRIQSEGGVYGLDLLGLILEDETKGNTKGPKLTTQHVIDECKTFFFAGHETTSTLLTWASLLLATNPEWQDRAREEVLAVCGRTEVLTAEAMGHLKIVSKLCYIKQRECDSESPMCVCVCV